MIGYVIEFAGSNWYVIEDSPASKDYVVLLKENRLSGVELTTDYAYNGSVSYDYMFIIGVVHAMVDILMALKLIMNLIHPDVLDILIIWEVKSKKC